MRKNTFSENTKQQIILLSMPKWRMKHFPTRRNRHIHLASDRIFFSFASLDTRYVAFPFCNFLFVLHIIVSCGKSGIFCSLSFAKFSFHWPFPNLLLHHSVCKVQKCKEYVNENQPIKVQSTHTLHKLPTDYGEGMSEVTRKEKHTCSNMRWKFRPKRIPFRWLKPSVYFFSVECVLHSLFIYNMYMLKAYISCRNLFFYERTRSQWNMRSTPVTHEKASEKV